MANHEPFVDGGKNIIDAGFHWAVFLPHLIPVDNLRSFTGTDGQIDEGDFTDTAAKDRISATNIVEYWEIPNE